MIKRLFNFIYALFEPNPVFKRELRARWRRPAAYLTLFFYAAPLALGMGYFYNGTVETINQWSVAGLPQLPANFSYARGPNDQIYIRDPYNQVHLATWFFPTGLPRTIPQAKNLGKQMSAVGQRLYRGLILFQVIAWLLIAPAITAPMIAMERERGLLEALQLANLPPRRVVMGKWMAALAFVFLLLFVPIPVSAIVFYFGGVSPQEFVRSMALVATTAVFGTALGLFFSSRRERPMLAMRDAFVVLTLSTVLVLAKPLLELNGGLRTRQAVAAIELAHPYFAATHFVNDKTYRWPLREVSAFPRGLVPSGSPAFRKLAPLDIWAVNVGLLAALTFLLLGGAMQAAAQPTREVVMMERRRWTDKLQARRQTTSALSEASLSALQAQRERLKNMTQDALLREIPFLSGRSFDNPVLGRELRGKTRWKSRPLPLQLAITFLSLLALMAYIFALGLAVAGQMQNGWEVFSQFGLVSLMMYAGAGGAAAFTREREGGTWEGIRLSLLTPAEILRGKFWPLALSSALIAFPVWLALLCCGVSMVKNESASEELAGKMLSVALVLASSIVFAIVCGLIISWFSRRTAVSTGLTTTLLLLLFFAMPHAWETFASGNSANLASVNPAKALSLLGQGSPFEQSQEQIAALNQYNMNQYYMNYVSTPGTEITSAYRNGTSEGFSCSGFLMVTAAVLLWLLSTLIFYDKKE